MNGLVKRALSGTIYVAVIVAGTLCGPVAFAALSLLLGVLAINEFSRLTDPQPQSLWYLRLLDVVGGVLLIGSVNGYLAGAFELPSILTPYLTYLISRLVLQLFVPRVNALKSLALSLSGQLYVALPLALMSVIYYYVGSPHLLLGLFIMIWLNDTGAFIVGSRIGKRKLWPRISPKKSWEGFWGGVIFAVAAGVLFGACWPVYFGNCPVWILAGLGAWTAVFATFGDLVESLIKRTLGVKD
ncbi:MAG: phosphatidate cytidylyltransferase, partial [Muribaculaceae bacterium]|nr:phosphatidate cytidylyltransferase [Muribaculaceae bacterium]